MQNTHIHQGMAARGDIAIFNLEGRIVCVLWSLYERFLAVNGTGQKELGFQTGPERLFQYPRSIFKPIAA